MKLGFLYLLSLFFFQFILLILPKSVLAHGFSKPFDTPISPPFLLFGIAAIIVISLTLATSFLKKNSTKINFPRFYLPQISIFRFFASKPVQLTIEAFFVFILTLLIVAGFFGKQNSALNITPVSIWIFFGIGLLYTSAFFGNIWQFINPVKTIFDWLDSISWQFLGKHFTSQLTYPKKWGLWPALVLFFIYLWIENSFGKSPPFILSLLILIYLSFTLQGMFLFGKEAWLRYADPFSVLFNLLSKSSLVDDRFYLRPVFVGLTQSSKGGLSEVILVLLFLAGLAFDQLKETIFWYRQTNFLINLNMPHELMVALGLLFLLASFIGIYFFLTSLMKVPAQRFIFALIPAGLGFGIAHSLVPLLIDGQRIFYLISDPFGFGWNLFGTAHIYQSYLITDVSALWRVQLILVLGGFIASLYVAHSIATTSSIPIKTSSKYLLLILLASYSILNLWILSQSLIGRV